MKIFIGKKTCWRHMPLNSAILPRRWLKENKFINNSSNVIFTSDEYFCRNKKKKNWDILHLLSSFAWSNRLLSVFNSVFSLSDVSCVNVRKIIILWQNSRFMKRVVSLVVVTMRTSSAPRPSSSTLGVSTSSEINLASRVAWNICVGWAIIGLNGITSRRLFISSVDCP